MSFARYPSLQGRVVFVTGGGSGIGAAMVEAFAAQGALVAFVDILEAESRALVERLGDAAACPLFIRCDLLDIVALRAAIASARERLGPIGVLVNNAANDTRQEIDEVTEADWDRTMGLNLNHQFFAAQADIRTCANSGAARSSISRPSPGCRRRREWSPMRRRRRRSSG